MPVAHRHGGRGGLVSEIGQEFADGIAVEIAKLRGSRVVDERGQAVAVRPEGLSARLRALSARIHERCNRSNSLSTTSPLAPSGVIRPLSGMLTQAEVTCKAKMLVRRGIVPAAGFEPAAFCSGGRRSIP